MAADTALKRYSAMNISSPWRGLKVVPNASKPQGELQAVMFMYSGILASTPTVSTARFLTLLGVGTVLWLILSW
jgi:hypothetical protein